MSYFEKFPLIVYEFGAKNTVVRDILCRSTFFSEYKPVTDLYERYNIVDGETPQMLAARFYGSSFYHWVILLFNEIHNPYFDWPLSIVEIESVCADKYGDAMYMTKYWRREGVVVGEIKEFNPEITWVPPVTPGNAEAVSFLDYEQELNDSRRVISIMRPELLGEFVKQFEEALNV